MREDGNDPRAVANLERLYREGKKWTALVELLKDQYDAIPDTDAGKPARPKGGEALGLRAVFAMLEARYPPR